MFFVFFFKQKTAYEMLRSLVGSEMCIRDRLRHIWINIQVYPYLICITGAGFYGEIACLKVYAVSIFNRVGIACLLYTSDAADDLLCVDLGGRRIIKKKKIQQKKKNTK